MTEQDQWSIETVRRFYRQEQEYAAKDIVWHVPGHNHVSGEYHGHNDYFSVMPFRMAPLDVWDFILKDVMVNGNYVVATFALKGERKGINIETNGAHIFRLNEQGQVAEGWGFTEKQDDLDAFFEA